MQVMFFFLKIIQLARYLGSPTSNGGYALSSVSCTSVSQYKASNILSPGVTLWR